MNIKSNFIIIIFIPTRGTIVITYKQANKINTDTNSDRKKCYRKEKKNMHMHNE